MYNHLLYFAYWIINLFVLYLASWVIPDDSVMLGNGRFNSIEAALYAGFWLTFLVWVFWDFAIAKEFNLRNKMVILGYFWFVNVFSLWVVSRFSYFTGFELTNYTWVLIIGLIATVLQRVAWKFVVSRS